MTLTKEQWLSKLLSWVPTWFTEDRAIQTSLFGAIAKVLADSQIDSESIVAQTFIQQATGGYLDLHGSERGIDRLTNESDSSYSFRVVNFVNNLSKARIKEIVDPLLIITGCKILEAPGDSPYCNRSSFLGRDNYLTDFKSNFFTIVVPKQVHSPYSFASRSYFGSRGYFAGSSDAPAGQYASIIALVNHVKAFGVMYRLIESQEATIV